MRLRVPCGCELMGTGVVPLQVRSRADQWSRTPTPTSVLSALALALAIDLDLLSGKRSWCSGGDVGE